MDDVIKKLDKAFGLIKEKRRWQFWMGSERIRDEKARSILNGLLADPRTPPEVKPGVELALAQLNALLKEQGGSPVIASTDRRLILAQSLTNAQMAFVNAKLRRAKSGTP